jgi:hypothetical protein
VSFVSLVRAAHPLTLDAAAARAVVLHRSLFTAPATLRIGEAEIDLTGCAFAEKVRLAPAQSRPPRLGGLAVRRARGTVAADGRRPERPPVRPLPPGPSRPPGDR